jgi:hypothetical protein
VQEFSVIRPQSCAQKAAPWVEGFIWRRIFSSLLSAPKIFKESWRSAARWRVPLFYLTMNIGFYFKKKSNFINKMIIIGKSEQNIHTEWWHLGPLFSHALYLLILSQSHVIAHGSPANNLWKHFFCTYIATLSWLCPLYCIYVKSRLASLLNTSKWICVCR